VRIVTCAPGQKNIAFKIPAISLPLRRRLSSALPGVICQKRGPDGADGDSFGDNRERFEVHNRAKGPMTDPPFANISWHERCIMKRCVMPMNGHRLVEIRIHGRGGQGSVVAAYLLATAAFEDGSFGQAFPSFGPERRGAPVTAFVRIADHPVRRRCQVQAPLFLLVQDEALLHTGGITQGLKVKGAMLVNSSRSKEELSVAGNLNVMTIPATALAQQILGRPVPNTALAAAFLSLTKLVRPDALEAALARQFSGEMLDRNTRLVREAAQMVPAGAWQELCDGAGA
jgi:pyruvate ferredoxin oxidoreductase gamma subunit